MNIYIMVDMEGISGIVCSDQVKSTEPDYEREGRKYMTWDVNACVEGCIKGGAEKIIVRDAHASGKNFIWEELNPNAEYVIGNSGNKRMPGIEECDGVILLGYHAMAGTPEAVLEHTWNSRQWQNLWINDTKCGEIAVDSGVAGDYNKPVLMVSGDDKACKEAEDFLSGVKTAVVKYGLDINGARLLSMENAHNLIRSKSCEAVQQYKNIKPYRIKAPVRMRLEKVERGQFKNYDVKPYMKFIDGRTMEINGSSVEEALKRLTS